MQGRKGPLIMQKMLLLDETVVILCEAKNFFDLNATFRYAQRDKDNDTHSASNIQHLT